jgi:LuxR family transcriptional regulator, maltose regulon positive regulatory protein
MSKVVDLVARRRSPPDQSALRSPAHPELARPRLEGLAADVAIAHVSAPAGYGKSMLMRRWQMHWQHSGLLVTWVTIADSDREAENLADHLTTALQPHAPSDGTPVGPARAKRIPQDYCARIKTAVGDRPSVLIVDDAHRLRGSAGESLLRELIAQRPATMRIAIASRGSVALGLSKMRLTEPVLDIGADVLRFDTEELQALLAACGASASTDSVRDLMRATDGWPALLTLAAQTLAKGEVEAARLLKRLPRPWDTARDYFEEQLHVALARKTAAFLESIGPLGRFSTAFATAVLGDGRVVCTTRQIDALGLPITRSADDDEWRVLHPMYSAHLEERMLADAPHRLRALHRAAAHWYAEHDHLSDAVRSAFASNDAAFAGELLARASAARKRIGRFRQFAAWATQLPNEVLDRYPTLRIEAACTHAALFEHEAARLYAEPVRLRFDDLPLIARDDLHAVDAVIAIYADRPESALETGLRGLRECQGHDPYTMGTLRLATAYGWIAKGAHQSARQAILAARADHEQARSAFGIACSLALSGLWHATQGQLPSAVADWNEADKAIKSLPEADSIEAVAVGYLPEALYEWNDLDGAEDVLRRCLLNSMDIALPDMVHCMFVAAARTAAARNEMERSREILDAAEVAGLRRGWPRLVQAVAWERVRAALHRGDMKEARQAHAALKREQGFEEPAGFLPHSMETEANLIGELRFEIAVRPTSSILGRIRAAISQATNQGRVWRLVRLLILEASALRALDNQAGALRSLRRALELGEPGRMVRSFADEGPQVLDLIEAILDEERRVPMTTATTYLEQILAAAGRVPGAPSSCKTQVEQLSRREWEVLQMLVAGLSNADIGARLFVSQHTVKWHLQHIFEKLGVKSRTQAAVLARAGDLAHT